MADFNKVLTPGDFENGLINVVIEIPKGGTQKIEWKRDLGIFQLDRIEPDAFPKPTNYGFIPQTLDEDGDELDVLVIGGGKIPTGVFLEARILGVMKFYDDKEIDDKIIAAPADNRSNGDVLKSLDDVNPQLIKQIEFHFNNYKALYKPGSTIVDVIEGEDSAKEVIRASIKRWNEQ